MHTKINGFRIFCDIFQAFFVFEIFQLDENSTLTLTSMNKRDSPQCEFFCAYLDYHFFQMRWHIDHKYEFFWCRFRVQLSENDFEQMPQGKQHSLPLLHSAPFSNSSIVEKFCIFQNPVFYFIKLEYIFGQEKIVIGSKCIT